MALVLADRVQETSTTTGTGTFTLAGAVTGFQTFAVIGNGNTTYYAITGGNEWEVGIGTYTSSGTTLSRDTVFASSNSNAKVDFSAGTKYVFVTYPEERAVYVNGTTVTIPNSATVPIASGGTGATTLAGANIPVTNASNTFTSAQTFRAASAIRSEAASTQDAVILAGRAGGTSSYAVTFTPTTLSGSRTLTLPDASGTVLQSGTAVTVAQGGTGITSGTSGGVPYFSSTSAIASSGALAANALVIGGGAGAAPSTTTTGANVLTALGVAVGSSGAFTTNNAANTFTAAQTFRAANAIRSEAASTQDAVVIAGRAGGTGSFAVTLTPTTLAANRTVTLADGDVTMTAGTMAVLGTAQTFTAAQTFRAANSVRVEAASTQDAIVLAGRAGGTGSFAITLTPATLASSTTLTLPNTTTTVAGLGIAQTWTAAQTFRAASAVRSEAASTQDAIVLAGRAGGTGSYAVSFTPTTLSANRTVTMPDADINFTTGLAVAQGGTGNVTYTAYGLLAAGTTSTGAFQQVSGTGTSGQVLTSNGASALPTWQTSTAASKGFAEIISMVFGL